MVLRERTSKSGEEDSSTASSFEAWRDLGTVRTVTLAVCAGSIRLSPAGKNNKLHLTITLPAELPHGVTIGSFIQSLDVGPHTANIFVKIPKRYRPEVVLEVPNRTATITDLGDGVVEIRGLEGDKTVSIARGDLMLRGEIERQYGAVKAAFGDGGIRDQRGPKPYTKRVHTWSLSGDGTFSLTASLGFGFLNIALGSD